MYKLNETKLNDGISKMWWSVSFSCVEIKIDDSTVSLYKTAKCSRFKPYLLNYKTQIR
jgi:hypothetical protein